MKNTVLLFCLLVSCTSPAPETGEELPQDPREWFRGRWKLHEIAREGPDGKFVVPESMAGRSGYILYDGLGGMGVHHIPAGYKEYPLTQGVSPDSLSRKDLELFQKQFIYFGRYTIDTASKVITHHIDTDARPWMWGEPVQRRYEFSGDTLILMPLRSDPLMRISWIRVNDK